MNDLRMGRMARSGASLLAVAALALSLGTVEGRVNHVFTLSGVSFDDGGDGHRDVHHRQHPQHLGQLRHHDLWGGTLTGFDYTPAIAGTTSFSSLPAILVLETSSLDHLIQLTFNGGLTRNRCSDHDRPIRQFRAGPHRRRSTGPCGLSRCGDAPSLNRPRSPWPEPPP